MSHTFADVDASSDPGVAIACQEQLAAWPAIAAYKQHSHGLVGSDRPVLDVGCGPGVDLLALGRGCRRVGRVARDVPVGVRSRRPSVPGRRARLAIP